MFMVIVSYLDKVVMTVDWFLLIKLMKVTAEPSLNTGIGCLLLWDIASLLGGLF